MMVLGPHGHVACGTDDAPIYYCGSQECRAEMEKLQATLERRGRRLVEWRRLGGLVGCVLAPVVLIGGSIAVLELTSKNAPLLAWLMTIAIGVLGALSAMVGFRHLLSSDPRPHKLILP
jgi:hypothetical protein